MVAFCIELTVRLNRIVATLLDELAVPSPETDTRMLLRR